MSEKQWFYDLTTEDSKEDRAYMRLWVGRVLALTVLLITTVYATGAYAGQLVARVGGDAVTLHDTPCKRGAFLEKWREAKFFYQGKNYEACWRLIPNAEMVIVIDSEGDVTPMPMRAFKMEEGV